MGGRRLSRDFFARDTLAVARDLLGQRLVRLERGGRLGGLIVETEAYAGSEDLGCHGRSGRTERNRSLWEAPGTLYVYFNYGMHWLANLVTERAGYPSAVLLRGIRPEEGLEVIRRRRAGRPAGRLTDGPAKLCQALGVDGRLDGSDVCGDAAELFVEAGPPPRDQHICRGPRVGLNSVPEPWKSVPWRFRVEPAGLPGEGPR